MREKSKCRTKVRNYSTDLNTQAKYQTLFHWLKSAIYQYFFNDHIDQNFLKSSCILHYLLNFLPEILLIMYG